MWSPAERAGLYLFLVFLANKETANSKILGITRWREIRAPRGRGSRIHREKLGLECSVLRVLRALHLILTTTLQSKCYYCPYFSDEKTESQRDEVICAYSQSEEVGEQGFSSLSRGLKFL